MDKAKDVASKVNSSSKQVKHKSAKNKGASSLKNVSSKNANNASGRIGVAAVALASTLSMLLPGATALAKTPLNADSFDSSYVKSAAKTSGKGAGKGNGKGDGNDLYKNGLLNTGATSERAMRQMVGSAKEYLVKHADSNADSNNSAAGVDNQEAAAGDSSVGVKDSGERSDAGSEASNDASSEAATDSATETATNGEQDNSDVAKPESKAVKKEQPAEAKPAETPASKAEPVKTEPAKTEVVNPTPAGQRQLMHRRQNLQILRLLQRRILLPRLSQIRSQLSLQAQKMRSLEVNRMQVRILQALKAQILLQRMRKKKQRHLPLMLILRMLRLQLNNLQTNSLQALQAHSLPQSPRMIPISQKCVLVGVLKKVQTVLTRGVV